MGSQAQHMTCVQQSTIHLAHGIAQDVAADAEFASANDAMNAGGASKELSQPSQPPQQPGSKGNKARSKSRSKQTRLLPVTELT